MNPKGASRMFEDNANPRMPFPLASTFLVPELVYSQLSSRQQERVMIVHGPSIGIRRVDYCLMG